MTKINNIAIDNILTRRSIRRFNVLVPVKQSDIECLIECASAAQARVIRVLVILLQLQKESY